MATSKKETTRKEAQPAARPPKSEAAPKVPARRAAPENRNDASRAAKVQAIDGEGSSAQEVAAEARQRTDVSDEQVARRAYELFIERGGEHGRHDEDWQRAERELRGGRDAGPSRH